MTAQEFIFDTPLYKPVVLSADNEIINQIKCWCSSKTTPMEGYNTKHRTESTFKLIKGLEDSKIKEQKFPPPPLAPGGYSSPAPKEDNRIIKSNTISHIIFECGRYGDELHVFLFLNSDNQSITKIGQYPSVADIHIGEIKQYKKILSDEKLKEFTRAIGLAANGVGIGSFVYLRRIFEFLVFEIANEAIESGEVKKQDFEKARMDEKIELLKDLLPPFLVAHKPTYSILSVGIHELSEEECLSYFDIMRVSIELILDERLEALQKAEKAKRASSAISAITSQIKAKK